MPLRNFIICMLLLAVTLNAQGQELKDDGDKYFYGYAYEDAIKAYEKQHIKGKSLSHLQSLNLADSYFKTGAYDKASKLYLEINMKDSVMSNYRFNNMLQSMSKTSEPQKVRSFFESKRSSMSDELFENSKFNYEILDDNVGGDSRFNVFSVMINGKQDDLSPAFYKDKVLFSSSRMSNSDKIYGPSGQSYLNIYEATIDDRGVLVDQDVYKQIPNSDYHRSTPYYSDKTKTIFYVLSNTLENGDLAFDSKGKNALAIGALSEEGSFKYVLKDLSTSFYYPFYDDSNDKLYFAANFPSGYGGTDLYFVYTNNSQVMSEPINLGPRINTPGNEIAPYIQENSLYFSSDIFYGLGGMDIYKSDIQRNDEFTIPVNLGPNINSQYDDFGFILRANSSKDGYLGYFASNKRYGLGGDDIYGFTISQKPGLRTLVFGGKIVSTRTGFGLSEVTIRLLDEDKNEIKKIINQENGDYRIEIPWRPNVSLEITKPKYSIYNKNFVTSNRQVLSSTANVTIDLAMLSEVVEDKEGKTVLKLDRFAFPNGQSEMTPEVAKELIKVIELVEQFPNIKLGIEVHTNSKGSDYVNKSLSQKRADTIKAYLLKNGVSENNIGNSIGYGETRLVNNCKNGVYCLDFLHEQNRRTLFVVLNYDEINQ